MSVYPNMSSPDWLLEEERLTVGHIPHFESIFTLANGYMGARGSLETNLGLGDPGFFVAGVFDRVQGHVHEIVNLPLWLGIEMNTDGFPVDLRKGTLLEYTRTLDMRQGILYTHIVWRDAANHTTRFELARLVHQADKHLALQWGTITPLDYSANIQFESRLDAWAVKYASPSQTPRLEEPNTRDLGDDGVALSVATADSKIRVATASRLKTPKALKRHAKRTDDRVAEVLVVPMTQGESLHFEKRVLVYTSRDVDDPESRAVAELKACDELSLKQLVDRHVAAWTAIWDHTDIRIAGDDRAQKAMRFNNFHLASLANPNDDRVSIGAKGLHGVGYAGVYFWDTEIYLLPFYIHTNPAAAKALLAYRYHFLADAKANARELGRKGAFYPWNSSLTGRARHWPHWQEHVGSDIAYGVDWYARATGDTDFLHREGAEIIFETVRYWQSRVEADPERGFVIGGTMGPDEIHGNIANNAFTNYLVKWHCQRAVALVDELKQADKWNQMAERLGLDAATVAIWREIAERMYVPFDAERGIHEQFEGYFQLPEKEIDRSLSRMQYTGPVQHSFKPTKVAQQADTVLMYWMFADDFPDDVRRAGYAYYDPRCSHTSSLSRSIFAGVAAQTGLLDDAYRQFILAAEADLAEGIEMESETGVHVACMGGTWLAAVTGFAGARLRGDVLSFAPALPEKWQKMTFPLAWKGVVLEVEISHRTIRLRTRSGATRVALAGKILPVSEQWTEESIGA